MKLETKKKLFTEIEKLIQVIAEMDTKNVILEKYHYEGGKMKNFTEYDNITKVKLLHARIKQILSYHKNGLMKIEDVPTSSLHADYNGKIS